MMAAADAGHLASGELADADVVSLESILAQADAIRASVAQLLAKRGRSAFEASDGTVVTSLPPNGDLREAKRRRSNDSAMQLD